MSILNTLENDPTLDQEHARFQIERCPLRAGRYVVNLIDREGYNRIAILTRTLDRRELHETYPVHGVTTGRGCKDSYGGLVAILQNGFSSLLPADINTVVFSGSVVDFFTSLAAKKRDVLWGYRSERIQTKDDRYFLEFRRFVTTNDRKERSLYWMPDVMHTGVDGVATQDIQVNVILGTNDPVEIRERTVRYKRLFDRYSVSYRFITAEGVIYSSERCI